jgi:hypothetical protein
VLSPGLDVFGFLIASGGVMPTQAALTISPSLA